MAAGVGPGLHWEEVEGVGRCSGRWGQLMQTAVRQKLAVYGDCWLLASLMVKYAELVCRAGLCKGNYSQCVSADNSLCFYSLLLPSSIHLSFASLGRVKPKWGLWAVPHEAEEPIFPIVPFLMRRILSRREVPSWPWTMPACRMGWWNCLPSLFMWLFSIAIAVPWCC